jgi:hypoxanthine phosphoribosyltransferase
VTPAPSSLRQLAGAGEIATAVARIGREVAAEHPDGVVLVGVLKGSFCFLSDLARATPAPVEIDFLAISSYGGGGGRVRLLKDLDVDICDRHVILVEDIVDTGLTTTYILGELRRRSPASLEACTLLDRPARRIVPVPLRHVGFTIPDEYVIGYGLDWGERYRNAPALFAADTAALDDRPDAYVQAVFGD